MIPKAVFYLAFIVAMVFAATSFNGKVVGISDGDTIRVLQDGKEIKVRLNGIDCPELGQGFSQVAKSFVSDMVFGQEVTVQSIGTDKYGRTLATIILMDGRNLNQELVRMGYAWHYKHYSSDTTLSNLEIAARNAKLGLWGEKNPVSPWDYRHGGASQGKGTTETARGPPEAEVEATPSPAHAEEQSILYRTATGAKYHLDGCRYLKSRIPTTLDEASNLGLSPCAVCKPGGNLASASPKKSYHMTIEGDGSSNESPSSYGGRCNATTKKGSQCKRTSRSVGYCWQHGG